MRTFVLLTLAAVAFLSACTSARPVRMAEHEDFARPFRDAGVSGTFVLYDPAGRQYFVHDSARAAQRFIPASTYKVLNALISLETGAAADTSTVFEWDGVEREIPQWNRDHSLTSAIRYSVVWYFQRLARSVGESRMRDYVQRVGYGNGDIGGGIDTFWLTGNLRISPLEQVAFLQRLHEHSLPFSDRTMNAVEDILVEERGPGYVLRGKTGWADWTPADIGWYVGYVVRDGKAYYFALNMDLARPEQAIERRNIVRTILKDMDLLP